MDSVDVCAATSTEDNKRRVNKKNRDWPNRLHLRPPTMQSEDKHGPKKIVELERSTMWPSSKKAHTQEEAHERPCRTINGGNSLRFKCSQCKDNVEYTPKDLVGHFEEKHIGISLVLSCHMCTFITHEFSYLQVHLLSHKDTLSCCSICKDNVQRTWSEFSTHLTMVHTQNGKYTCEMCNKFSTADDREFLEHILLHNLGLNRKSEYTVDRRTTQTFLCQHCGYEASQKMLINKHIKATHGHLNHSQRNKEVHSFAMKPNESVPKSKPRLTRSAVKEMCWLTQDCLSLPGREFLDKYCHLPDAQTTLEETEQFLMKSGEQTWTKALKTVFSNVPQDMTLHPKAENGLMSNSVFPDSSQDVTVLTVQNKITLAQNGATYPKRLKMMSEKDPEGTNADSCDKTVSDTNFNDCLQSSETKLNNDVLKSEPSEGPQMQENRENRRLKMLLDIAELNVITEEAKRKEDGIITNELKAIHYTEKKPVHKAMPKKKRKNRRWKKRSKQAAKHSARALKIVFKKNPETGKQWVTQSALSPTKCNSMEANEGLGQMDGILLAEKLTKALKTDVCEGQWTTLHKQEAEDMATGTLRATNTDENRLEMLEDGVHMEEELDSSSVNESKSKVAEKCHETSEIGLDLKATDEQKTPRDGSTEASPEPRPVITPQSETAAHSTVSSEPAVDGTREGVPADACLSSFEKPQFVSHWKPAPKNLERTLKIVAINPNQLVKRPAGDQPIVVLNHPDADIPEVARIMEVINRYKGEVHKVVLSKRTLNALSAINGEALNAPPDAAQNSKNSKVQERFLLKLKLRRLSRKKFEVVPAESSQGSDTETKFRCWFCGRVFENREIWSSHRQRHLMEWKSPNCENS